MPSLIGYTIKGRKENTTRLLRVIAISCSLKPWGHSAVGKRRHRQTHGPGVTVAAWLLGFSTLLGSHGNGYAQSGIGIEEFRKQRPAQFYQTVLSQSSDVCDPILQSLNMPYTKGAGPREEPRALMYVPQFIEGWRVKMVNWVNPNGQSVVIDENQLIVDINNDARADALYRSPMALGSVLYDRLAVSLNATPEELSAAPLSNDAFRKILHLDNGPGLGGVVQFTKRTIDTPGAVITSHGYYWWDVVVVAGRYYLIATDALYWRSTAVTSILEYEGPEKLKLLCQFKGVMPIHQ